MRRRLGLTPGNSPTHDTSSFRRTLSPPVATSRGDANGVLLLVHLRCISASRIAVSSTPRHSSRRLRLQRRSLHRSWSPILYRKWRAISSLRQRWACLNITVRLQGTPKQTATCSCRVSRRTLRTISQLRTRVFGCNSVGYINGHESCVSGG